MTQQTILVADHGNMRYQCSLSPDKVTYTISGEIEADFYIPHRGHPFQIGLHAVIAEFSDEGNLEVLVAMTGSQGQNIHTQENIITRIDDVDFHIEYQNNATISLYLETEKTIHFGQSGGNKVTLTRCLEAYAFVLDKNKDDAWMLHPFPNSQERIYINGCHCWMPHTLENGDIIHFDGYRIRMADDYLTLYHQNACGIHGLITYEPETNPESRYPDFQRPPRILYPVPTDKVTIPNPPSPPQKDRYGLLIAIAPVAAMLLAMIVMSMIGGRGIFMLAMVAVMGVTGTITTYRYLKDKKHKKEDEVKRVAFYKNQLNERRKLIRELIQKQRQALQHSNPTPQECVNLAHDFSPRLWERASTHTDFLQVRIGEGDQLLSFPLEYTPQETKETAEDPLSKEAEKLVIKYAHNPSLPLSISLKDAYVGVVGRKCFTLPHILAILSQLIVLHSYLDMTLVVIYSHTDEQTWLPFKWAPHTWLGDHQFKGLVYNNTTRDNVLLSVHQILKRRRSEYESSGGKIRFQPIVIAVADLDLIYNHVIMEYLGQDFRHLGLYAIFISDNEFALPEAATTQIRVSSETQATLYQEKNPVRRPYTPDRLTESQVARATRALAPLRHIMISSDETIPSTITLFELLKVADPRDLDILGKWKTNKPYKSLGVPLGLRGTDSILELNLHEKAHGPHGLMAGTTGSGKSEVLQSYIASMAIHFHPHDLAFLLIDYKGGSMANLFKDLPHLLGAITNMDPAQAMRALIAIKSELRRRQTVLGLHDVNHIDSYQKLCAGNPSLPPMPHLFIIADEFAELKTQQPEFMAQLVSAARIGRSLGVHLILCTQKPSGVIDDQIWSNSNFRICLKVQNPSDSSDVLKTHDAADIRLPGRGYLQVGNNDIYELFQSAYSGAEYHPDKTKAEEKPDQNIYIWNELGQIDLLTKDFSAMHVQDTSTIASTELDVVIQAVEKAFQSTGLEKIPSPWLPPLSERIYLPDLLNNPTLKPQWADTPDEALADTTPEGDTQIIVGMTDEVDLQRQSPLTINFTQDGHIGVWGSAGTGKSTFLRTIALSLALKYTPRQAAFFILDFGSNALMPLTSLPHTADTLTLDDTEKLNKLQRLLAKEMKNRKEILGNSKVSTITLHNKISPKRPISSVFIFIDNMDIIREQNMTELETLLKDISKEGQALSLYLIFAGTRPNGVRYTILGNIKKHVTFYMIDKSDIVSLIGRTEIPSENLPGRGLVNTGNIYSFQAALPTEGESEEARITTFQQTLDILEDLWTGPSPLSVPMMPDIITLEEYFQILRIQEILETENKKIPLALNNEDLGAFSLDFSKIGHINITGSPNIGKTNTLRVLLESLSQKALSLDLTIIDDERLRLKPYQKRFPGSRYLTTEEEISSLLKHLAEEAGRRKKEYVQKIQEDDIPAAEYYATLMPHLIIINNLTNLMSKVPKTEHDTLGTLIDDTRFMGIHFCIVSNLVDFPKTYDRLATAIKNIPAGITFVPLNDSNQILPTPKRLPADPIPLRPGEANFILSGSATLIKIPLAGKASRV